MEVFVGEFDPGTGTGTKAVTGVGFTPNALIFLITVAGSSDTWIVDAAQAFGYATGLAGSETVCDGYYIKDATINNAGFYERWNDNGGIRLLDAAATVIVDFTIDSFDVDGFTIDKATGAAITVKFMALSCDDAFAGADTSIATTGTKAWTGFGFKPDLFLVTTTNNVGIPFNGGVGSFAIGATDGTREFSIGQQMSYPVRDHKFNAAQVSSFSVAGATVRQAEFSSFDADGITLDYKTTASTRYHCFLALKDSEGFYVKADWDTASSTGDESVTGLGIKPRGLMFLSHNSSDITDRETDLTLTTGFADENGNENSLATVYEDAADPADADSFIDSNDCFHGGHVSPATDRVADHQSMDSDGYTVKWESVSGSVRSGVIAFGNNTSGPPPAQDNVVPRTLIKRAREVPAPVAIW